MNVPPLGRLLATGRSVQSFENFVRGRLGEVLVDPSVIVQLTNRKSSRVTVLGTVRAPGAISLSTTESRLTDIITAAGGPAERPEDLDVTLTRNGRSATVPLDRLYGEPGLNISALRNDVISVGKRIRQVTVLGAFSTNTRVRLEGDSVSLTEAIGQFGGLIRDRAKLTGIYVFRETPKNTLASIGVNVSRTPGETVPTIYRFDFTKPTVFFTADNFQIADGDILYATQSGLASVNDFISAISPVIAAPRIYGSNLGLD